jgi:glycosyltransferase involved in cell wall biosynthesis
MLFDPHNPQELSRAILKVTCEPDVRRDLVDRGLARAREFTWERAARQTLAVFSELVAEKAPPVARGEARTALVLDLDQ